MDASILVTNFVGNGAIQYSWFDFSTVETQRSWEVHGRHSVLIKLDDVQVALTSEILSSRCF